MNDTVHWRANAANACLVIIDVQEKLFLAMSAGAQVEANIGLLLDVTDALDIPVIVTEHMVDKIGPTIGSLTSRFPGNVQVVSKTHFSASDEPMFIDAVNEMAKQGRSDFLVTGLEAHVCVQQTALGLAEMGQTVRIAVDATGSRDQEDKAIAMDRMRGRGCDITSTEAIAFEWLERGDTPAFKKMLRTIRDRRAPDDQ